MQRIIILVVAIAIIGLGAYYMSQGGTELAYTATVEEENAVLLVNQPAEEDSYVVSYAKLSEPGYVLIYGTNPTTGATEAVGTSDLLPAGEHTNVRITKRNRSGTNERAARMALRAAIVADNGDGAYSQADTEVLAEASGAEESEDATDPEELTGEEITELLEDAGYTVIEEGSATEEEGATTEENVMEEEGATTDETTKEDGAMMETDEGATTE